MSSSISPSPVFHPSVPQAFIVGLDVASLKFVVRLLSHGTPLGNTPEFDNGPAGFKALQIWLKEHGALPSETLVVMEATGVYWEECALALYTAGFAVNVVNPARIKSFARTLQRRAKTDSVDADLIARFALSVPLTAWQPPSLEMGVLQLIMRQREDYITMRDQERNRLHAQERSSQAPAYVLNNTRRHIAFLERRIKDIENTFKKELKKYPEWHKSVELLQTIPGIGSVTAAVFFTETRALNGFVEARQVTAYSGIAPAPYSSGSSVCRPSSISKIGDPRLRKAFYMAALSATRLEASPFRAFYLRLCGKGKPAKVALVAVARKLMVLCFRVMRSQMPYDPAYRTA
jgi:transposase